MHYMPQVFVPCSMFFILSWITFWLKRSAYNVRLAICVLSLVMMTIGCQVLGTQVPKTAYAKAIDVYTGVCMTFVFIALIGELKCFKSFKKYFVFLFNPQFSLTFAIFRQKKKKISNYVWNHQKLTEFSKLLFLSPLLCSIWFFGLSTDYRVVKTSHF